MRCLWRFAALSALERKLFARAVSALLESRARLRISRTEQLRRWAAGGTATPRPGAPQGAAVPVELARAVERASRVVRGSTCLMRALALQRLMSQHGYSSQLLIGVDKTGTQFSAHAWLMHDGQTLLGEGEEAEKARVLMTFPTAGDAGEQAPASAKGFPAKS